MRTPRSACLLPVLLAVGVCARAAEAPTAHVEAPPKVVLIGTSAVVPPGVSMGPNDVLEFKNVGFRLLTVTFIDPKDAAARIRCDLAGGKTAEEDPTLPPWDLFVVRDGRLVANVPPGRFTSLCHFAPGDYAFEVRSFAAREDEGMTPLKGAVHVE